MENRWRVGKKVGRTLYRDDELIGLMDKPEDAALIVRLANDFAAALAEERKADLDMLVKAIDELKNRKEREEPLADFLRRLKRERRLQ